MTAVPKPPRTPKKARKPVRRRNVKRHKNEWLRAYGSEERVRFVASLPCVTGVWWCRLDDCENAHVESGGKSRKADASKIAPICSVHHNELHYFGRTTFERIYHVDLSAAAVETERRWQCCLEWLKPGRKRIA